jgi:hypothetical protein
MRLAPLSALRHHLTGETRATPGGRASDSSTDFDPVRQWARSAAGTLGDGFSISLHPSSSPTPSSGRMRRGETGRLRQLRACIPRGVLISARLQQSISTRT